MELRQSQNRQGLLVQLVITMCAKDHNTKNESYIEFTMYYLAKICVILFKRVLKTTLYELLWTIMMFLFVIIIWTWVDSTSDVEKQTAANPVIVWWTSGFPGTSETRQCANSLKCEVYSNRNLSELYDVEAYLFYGSNINFDDLPLPRQPEEIIWGLYHEESPRNIEMLMHEKTLNIFNYSATISRHSDVPFPLQYLESLHDITSTEYFVATTLKNSYLKEISPIMYLQTDCETSTERDAYVKELMNFTEIDSYGACLNNKIMPKEFTEDYLNNLNEIEFLKFIARYKFVIAIENGVCEDYVTEKFWRAIKVGTVPIYFGSPSVKDWFPNNKSAILIENFPTPKILVAHINELMDDDNLYEEYLEHKTKQVITNKRLIEELNCRPYQTDALKTVQEFECYVCERLHEKRNGKLELKIVNKSHYNCPKPISTLTLGVNPANDWVYSWEVAKEKADALYKSIIMQK